MSALLVVDVQVDFCPGGALPVPGGDRVIPVINALMKKFPLVVASQDWHPPRSSHFERWPVHCVWGTPGAELHPRLDRGRILEVFRKGTGERDDGYSAFGADRDLAAFLRSKGVTELYIAGLATDYCVFHSALDAVKAGLRTLVVTDAVAAVDARQGDGEAALCSMRKLGVRTVASADLPVGVPGHFSAATGSYGRSNGEPPR